MMKFEIGDVVRMKRDGGFTKDDPTRLKLVVQELCATSVLVASHCKQHHGWVRFDEIELVHRLDRQANLEQAIRKVLLSDEFMEKFATAFIKTPWPMAMPCDDKDGERIKSLADYPFGEPQTEVANDPA